jgi:hypothetical protein
MAKKPSAFGKVLEEKKPEASKGGGKDYDSYKFDEVGPADQNLFDLVTALKTAESIIDGELKNIEIQLKENNLLDKFIEIGTQTRSAPETYVAQGEVSMAKVSLKYKATSAIDDKTLTTLEGHGIDLDYKEVVSIKKNVLENEEMVMKIIDALRKADIDPNDVLDKSMKIVASSKTIDSVFEKVSNKSEIKDLLKKVAQVTIMQPHFSDDPVDAKAKVGDIVKNFGLFV